MTYLDDASCRAFARFYAYEGTIPAMDCFRLYGMPLARYTDHHTTYKSPTEPTIEEQLSGWKPHGQFERSLKEWGWR